MKHQVTDSPLAVQSASRQKFDQSPSTTSFHIFHQVLLFRWFVILLVVDLENRQYPLYVQGLRYLPWWTKRCFILFFILQHQSLKGMFYSGRQLFHIQTTLNRPAESQSLEKQLNCYWNLLSLLKTGTTIISQLSIALNRIVISHSMRNTSKTSRRKQRKNAMLQSQ